MKSISKCLMNYSVVALVVSMLLLVFFVIWWIRIDYRCNIEFKDAVLAKLDSLEYVTTEIDSVAVTTLNGKDVKELLTSQIFEKSSIMYSNNYLAIILTLITLCVSLSVVIPYIVGKSVTTSEIRDVVDKYYQRDKANVDQKFRNHVEQLLLAEGHLSRMVSYNLLNSSREQFPEDLKAKYDGKSHPFWALGWASKLLIRYVVCYKDNSNSYNEQFIADCVSYIADSTEAIVGAQIPTNPAIDFKGKMLRALVDLLDVIGFCRAQKNVLNHTQLSILDKAFNCLYEKIHKQGVSDDVITDLALKKSKYKDYLKSPDFDIPSVDDFKRYLSEKINLACPKNS